MPLTPNVEPVPLKPDRDGVMRVGDTRVTLDAVVAAFHDGATAEETLQRYPSLQLADVYAVISYYLRHRGEVEAYLEQRRRQAGEARQKAETSFDPASVKDRLMARRTDNG